MAAVVGVIRDPAHRNNVKVTGQRSRLRAELSVSSRSTSATEQGGQRVTYRIVVRNCGPKTARGILVAQPLRKGRSRTIAIVATATKPRATTTLASVISSSYDPRSVSDVSASRSD